jgi:hypothetical protein
VTHPPFQWGRWGSLLLFKLVLAPAIIIISCLSLFGTRQSDFLGTARLSNLAKCHIPSQNQSMKNELYPQVSET